MSLFVDVENISANIDLPPHEILDPYKWNPRVRELIAERGRCRALGNRRCEGSNSSP